MGSWYHFGTWEPLLPITRSRAGEALLIDADVVIHVNGELIHVLLD